MTPAERAKMELSEGQELPDQLIIQARSYQLTDGHIGRPTEDRKVK